MNENQLLREALHALENPDALDELNRSVVDVSVSNIRAALSHPAQSEGGEVAGWLIDWPDEPELGDYFAHEPSETGRSRPLYTTPPASQEQAQHWTEREPVRLASHRIGRVYIAGPMTGVAEFNFPAFNAETALLRGQGLSVLNPAEHGIVDGAEWADYLRHDIAGLASCERIHLLRGWSKSKGAALEVTIAKAFGMVITYQDGAEQAQQPQAQAQELLEALRGMLSLDEAHQRGHADEDVCAEVRAARAAIAKATGANHE